MSPARSATKGVQRMRERVTGLQISPAHEAALRALLSVRPWPVADEAAQRKESPNGLHRLKDKVPELAPDQPALARLLVEAVLHHRRGDFQPGPARPSGEAQELFDAVRADPEAAARIVRMARRGDSAAWDACAMFYWPVNRVRFAGEAGSLSKAVDSIPRPVDRLLTELLSGDIGRPLREIGTLSDATRSECGALVFAIWAGTESALSATSRTGTSVCGILADLAGVSRHDIAKLWQSRVERPDRGRRW